MTLRQITLVLAGESKRRELDLEVAYFTAWHAGLFSQSYENGKFPKYDDANPLAKAKQKQGPQSWQEQKRIAQNLNAAFGGVFQKG